MAGDYKGPLSPSTKFLIVSLISALLVGSFVAMAPGYSLFLANIIFALIFLVYLLPKPEILFLGMIFFLPFTGVGILEIGVTVTLSKILAVVICLSFITIILLRKQISLVKTPFDGFLISFLILTIIFNFLKTPSVPVDIITAAEVGILRSPHFRFLNQLLNLSLMIAIYFFTMTIVNSEKMVIRSINTLFFSTFLVSVYGLYQFAGSFFSWPFTFISQVRTRTDIPYVEGLESVRRINSTFPEPKNLAFFLIPVILLLLYFLIKEQNLWRKRKFYFLFCLFVVIFLLTFSRSAWVLLGISIILVSPIIFKKNILSYLKVGSFTGVILLGSFGLLNWLIGFQGSSAILHRWRSINFATYMTTIDYPKMRAAMDIFAKHPLLGIGYGNFPFFLSESGWIYFSQIEVAPNEFLMILVETGVLGFLLFICFIFGSLIYSLWAIKKIQIQFWQNVSIALLFAVIGILVSLQYATYLNQPYFWLFIGLLKASIRLGLKESISKKLNKNLNSVVF